MSGLMDLLRSRLLTHGILVVEINDSLWPIQFLIYKSAIIVFGGAPDLAKCKRILWAKRILGRRG